MKHFAKANAQTGQIKCYFQMSGYPTYQDSAVCYNEMFRIADTPDWRMPAIRFSPFSLRLVKQRGCRWD